MKVAIVGATGQLGMALRRLAPHGVHVTALLASEMDVGDAAQVNPRLRRIAPDLVINAAAYTEVDQAESNRESAFRVNADGPAFLAEAALAVGSSMIHVSTDFVFAGDRPVPYDVDLDPAPLSVYGESKAAGERAVIAILGSRATVIRTSWLYASEGRNFVKTMLSLLRSRDSVSVVYDQVGGPTWANSLAKAIWTMSTIRGSHGIQHWSDAGVASWYDFAVAIQEEALTRGLLDRRIPIRPIRTSEYPTPARRPRYSVLDTRVTAALLGHTAPHWRDNLRSMLDELAGT